MSSIVNFFDDYYVNVPSEGSQEKIAKAYLDHMDIGYNLTAKEISDYLNVSELWVSRHVQAKYIWINSTARYALNRYYPESKYKSLFKNKKLFKRSSFEFFLKNNTYYIVEPNKTKHSVVKLPERLITRSKSLEKYGVSYTTFYNKIKGSSVKKYFIHGQPRYSEKELDYLFIDMQHTL
ncbi:hypothetical protein ABE151_17320 [Bacillus paralicheniformis]|uniref:hypothetical protein n=1 Tax=Bacillus paralicheniformis TaxID=1648923 RepID=UPI003D1B0E5A